MKNKKMVLWIALIIMAIIPVYAQQYDSESDFSARPIDGGKGVEITYYRGSKWEVRIPQRIQNIPVTRIGDKAFGSKRDIISVTIPNSVTSIGDSAFHGCKSLNSITIPNGVTSIEESAFGECESLTSVTIPNSVTSIGNRAFHGCKSLTSVTIPNSVTSIGNSAFYGCSGLTSITIPNSVTSIGGRAFSDCKSLKSITIPNSVTSIIDSAFRDCTSLTEINVNSGNTSYSSDQGVLYNKKKTALLLYPIGKTDRTFTIPNGVTSIGEGFVDAFYAFSSCSSLTEITIPDSVTTIGYGAFSGCTGLTSITIPNSVTYIDVFAFSGCTSLTSVTFQCMLTEDFIANVAFGNQNLSGGRYYIGDLRAKVLAGGIGTYTRPNTGNGGTWTKTSAESYFKNGYAALQRNDYDKAIADFTQAILLNKNADGPYFLRAMAYDGKGDYDNAIVDYTNNIQLDPNNELAYIRRGNIYFIKQDYDKAIADYNQAIRLVPNNKGYKKGLEIIQRRGKSSVEFPAGFVGTWKRDKFNNTLTFDKNSFKASNQNSTIVLSDLSGNSYTFYWNGYPASNSTLTIRLVKGDLVISGDSGNGEDNWNGTWKKQ